MPSLTLQGTVLQAGTQQPIAHLKVEAWDRDLVFDDPLGHAMTDANGQFTIQVNPEDFRGLFTDRYPDVYFKIYRGKVLLKSTVDTTHKNVNGDLLNVQISLETTLESHTNTLKGAITLSTEGVAVGVGVKLFSKTLQEERELAQTTTNSMGHFTLEYVANASSMIVKVYNPGGKTAIAESDLLLNPQPGRQVHLVIDSAVYNGAALFDLLQQSVRELLGKRAITDLDDAELKLLAHESDWPPEHIDHLQKAHASVRKDELFSVEVFFALLHAGEAIDAKALQKLSSKKLKHALAESWEQHIISKDHMEDIAQQVAKHEKKVIRHKLNGSSFASELPLKEVWSLAAPTDEQLERLGAQLHELEEQPDSFWRELKNSEALRDLVPQLETLTQLNNLTFGNLGLIQQLKMDIGEGSLEDLAGWSEDRWKTAIEKHPIPKELADDKEVAPQDAYARSMKRMVDYLYPNSATRKELVNDPEQPEDRKRAFQHFFESNPDFDITRHQVDLYFSKNTSAGAGLSDPDRFQQELAHTQRLFNVSPPLDRYQNMRVLSRAGVKRAVDITDRGFSGFTKEFVAAGGTQEDAVVVLTKASHVATAVSMSIMQIHHDLLVQPYVLNFSHLLEKDPNWSTFFGSEDHCECKHCRSVYSPAAYLADSLHFLENRNSNGTSAYEVLDSRRPDIKDILLNCENANTAMPYIDLVNEVLERAVIETREDADAQESADFQSTGSSEELLAQPEHIQHQAYSHLKTQRFPLSMPFDLHNRLGRTYLRHLGVEHHRLVSLFPGNGNEAEQKRQHTMAVLSMNETDWSLLTGEGYEQEEHTLWGLARGADFEDIVRLAGIMKTLGLDWPEMRDLLASRFVDPDNVLEAEFLDGCSIDGAQIINFRQPVRKRMLQLLRLRNKLGTSIRTTDHILVALGASVLDADVLHRAAQLSVWQQTFKLDYAELCSWAGVLPTVYPSDQAVHRERYEEVFLNRFERLDEDTERLFDPRRNTRNGLKANYEQAPLVRNHIMGALRITQAEYEMIIEQMLSQNLNINTLSEIAAYPSLAKALQISIRTLIILKTRLANPAEARQALFTQLIEWAVSLQECALDEEELVFLFGRNDALAMSEEEKRSLLESVYIYLRFNENNEFFDDDGQPLAGVDLLQHVLANHFDLSIENIRRLLGRAPGEAAYLVPENRRDAGAYLDILLEAQDHARRRGPHPYFSQERFPVLLHLCDQLSRISMLINRLDLDERHCEVLLSEGAKEPWIDLNQLGSGSELQLAFHRLLQVHEIIRKTHHAEANVLALMLENERDEDWQQQLNTFYTHADLHALGTIIGLVDDDFASPAAFLRLLSAASLEQRFGIHIREYLDDNGHFTWAHAVLDRSKVSEIIQVSKAKHGQDRWHGITKELRDVVREEQREALLSYLTRTRIPGTGLLDSPEKLYAHFLLDVKMSACTVTSRIKLALSSVQLFVQRCLMNLEPGVSLANSSREERQEWEEWSWRKNYRVWEANRKVFLYPENWLEPEWRDDKTPFFKELEEELQQNELNDDAASKAYLNYLGKLDVVSNMEIMAVCIANPMLNANEEVKGYYIFGRSHGTPKTLFLRKYDLGTRHFTAWEKVDVEVEGEHLIPAIHNGHLHLFWPIIKEQSPDRSNQGASRSNPGKELVVQMAWSKHYNGKWEPKKITSDLKVTLPGWRTSMRPKDYLYFAYNAGRSTINVYHFNGFYYPILGQFDFSQSKPRLLPPPVDPNEYELANEDWNEDLFSSMMQRIRGGTGVGVNMLNQRLVFLPHETDDISTSRYLRLGNRFQRVLLRSDEDTHMAVSVSKYGLPFIAPIAVAIQDEELAVLMLHQNQHTEVLPLQQKMTPQFGNDVSSYGIHSPEVHQNWMAFQNETFKISGSLALDERLIPNPEFFNQNIPAYNLPAFRGYHWELFFHIPVYIANRLRQDQKFEEAQQWFHRVFNPTSTAEGTSPEKFWLFRPFRELLSESDENTAFNIREWMRQLNGEHEEAGWQELEQAVHEWEQNPFSPHTVARTRIVAYMKWVVMRYIDNLIEWADQLFRRDTIESLNEATQRYMLAWNILGPESQSLEGPQPLDRSYAQIRGQLDEFSNALFRIEERLGQLLGNTVLERDLHSTNLASPLMDVGASAVSDFPRLPGAPKKSKPTTGVVGIGGKHTSPVPSGTNQPQRIIFRESLYFCIPQNEKLLGYWSLVQDRFFKLRNCLNIEGVYRQLPLYEPPIDPAMLIRARAAGLSIADALSAQFDTRSHYRFLPLLQKAIDYANDVRSFGGALLSALEKRDSEQLSALRSDHQVRLLEAAADVRKEQVRELEVSYEALEHSRENIENRKNYYAQKEYMNGKETAQMAMASASQIIKTISHVTSAGAAAAAITPDYQAGYSGMGGHFTAQTGGSYAARAANNAAKAFAGMSGLLDLGASMMAQMASYDRRMEDWEFQESNAEIELKQIEKQMVASGIRKSIAEHELRNHQLNTDQSQAELEVIQSKFTNAELYQWMTGQLKTIYFQSYQMAFDMAKKAEHALNHELGIGADNSESFVKFGYWDSLREGLLSGEKLHHDLKRMEMTYLQRNKRRQEVSQTFSLALYDPEKLQLLQANGTCDFNTPQVFFDLAFPRHTNRRIKSVSITIPAVTGPYTGVHATLSNPEGGMISTSSAQNDSGLFQLNFNDERYLPFEGVNPEGAAWSLSLNEAFRSFDYSTISDVLLHVHYTAEQGDEDRSAQLLDQLNGVPLKRYVSLRNEFPHEWLAAQEHGDALVLTLPRTLFPFAHSGSAVVDVAVAETVTLPESPALVFETVVENTDEGVAIIRINTQEDLSALDDLIMVIDYALSAN